MYFLQFIYLIASILLVTNADEVQKKGDMNSYLKRTAAKFMEEVAERPNIQRLQNGLLVEILQSTTDPSARSPTRFDSCELQYVASLKDGTIYEEATRHFSPHQVFKGWGDAMVLMAEGDRWKVYVPPELAYGEAGREGAVPPHSPVIIDVNLIKVKSTRGKTLDKARHAFQNALYKAHHGEEL